MSRKNEKIEEEWDNNELCPCGSGKTYKDCCKKKAIKYYKKDEKPDMDEYQKLKDQTGATEIILNTIDDDPLNSIIKENIDI